MKAGLRTIDRVFLVLFSGIVLGASLIYGLAGQSIPEYRQPVIAYLRNPLESPEIWLTSVDGSNQQQLTHTGGKVFDFSVSPDGENLIASVLNESGGTDLYRIDRDGKNPTRLVECGSAHCVQPVWQSSGKIIAYSQYTKGLEIDGSIRLIDTQTGSRKDIAGEKDLVGAYPSFSPDGVYLAYFDYADSAFHILDLTTGDEWQVPANKPEFVTWSRDSKDLYFTQMIMNGLLPQSRLFKVDVSTKQIMPFLPDELSGYDASPIEWSPDGEWGVFGLTEEDIQSGRQIYLVRSDGLDLQAITNEPGTSHTAYHWSPAGDQIVFQRYRVGTLNAAPEVILWDMRTRTTTVLSENGALPNWMP